MNNNFPKFRDSIYHAPIFQQIKRRGIYAKHDEY